jgi:hypothetical protein
MDEEREETIVIGEQDLADEPQIRFALMEFFNHANSINEENLDDKIDEMKARRNVLLTMMRIYLAKFNNEPILKEFEKQLETAKKEASDKYEQYLKEIEVVGKSLSYRDNIAQKLAEQLLNAMMEEKTSKGDDSDGC